MSGLGDGQQVIDRDGHVWVVCRDGAMATRADAAGPISAGINWLNDTAGPLIPFDGRTYYAVVATGLR